MEVKRFAIETQFPIYNRRWGPLFEIQGSKTVAAFTANNNESKTDITIDWHTSIGKAKWNIQSIEDLEAWCVPQL